MLGRLLYTKDDEVLNDTCWAFANLSAIFELIDDVIQVGGKKLVEFLRHPKIAIQAVALRTVGNVITGTDHQTQQMLNFGAITAIAKLLSSKRKETRKEACWIISNITGKLCQ
jgi:hypothetical protein